MGKFSWIFISIYKFAMLLQLTVHVSRLLLTPGSVVAATGLYVGGKSYLMVLILLLHNIKH